MSAPSVTFRRALIDRETGCVCVETRRGEFWHMPNPTSDGRSYDPDRILAAVVKAGRVHLDRWERTET